MYYDEFMKVALEEAKTSLKEGNNGFGAVIIKDNSILVSAHDKEETESDPTSHAELNAIRLASQKYGKNFEDCILISTHEPCPMCATAIIWSEIKTLIYGYSITEAIAEGRKRINLTCTELFERANINIIVQEGVMHDQCSLLYRKDVRDEIKKLRGAKKEDLESLKNHLLNKRIEWYKKNQTQLGINNRDLVVSGYELLLKKLEIEPEEAPIVMKTKNKVVFHSKNFCPTLEACRILDLDTRMICKEVNEKPTDALVKQLSDRLEFARNYEKLRPYCDYCEEMVLSKEVD
jgi:tRNA(adenine34) deaminase